jgi:hypothetical protein
MKYLCLLLLTLPAFGQFGAASRIISGTGAPVSAQCTVQNNVGLVWARKDGAAANTTFYVCGATGVGTYGWELIGGGGASGPTACEIVIGDPGTTTPVLADDNDTPAVCANVSGSSQTITAIACYANAGSPTVNPIITGGGGTSLLSAPLTCGTGSYASGTLSGTPSLSNGATIDANIATAGGVAKYIVIRIVRQ